MVSVNTETDTQTASLHPSAAEGSDSQEVLRGAVGTAASSPRALADLPQDANGAALTPEQGRPLHGPSDQLAGLRGARRGEAG